MPFLPPAHLKGQPGGRDPFTSTRPVRTDYLTVLIGPPLTPSKPIVFSKVDAFAVHFPHNDALIVSCTLALPSVQNLGRSINILYEGALNKMEDSPKMVWAMGNPQTQSNLYGFDENETRSQIRSHFLSAPIRTMSSESSLWSTLSPRTTRSSVDLGSTWWG